MFKYYQFALKWNMSKQTISSMILHISFFSIRTLAFTYLLFILYEVDKDHILNIFLYEDIGDWFAFHFFILYFHLKSTINRNIPKSFISTIMIFHNALLVYSNCKTHQCVRKRQYTNVGKFIAISYIIEGILTVYLIYVYRAERNMEFFKELGVNLQIKRAYFIRKCLIAINEINVVVSTIVFFKLVLPPIVSFDKLSVVTATYALITYIHQIFVSVFLHKEIVVQRKLAIFIALLKIPFSISLIFINVTKSFLGHLESTSITFDFLFIDVLILTVLMTYFLIEDYLLFGSGLKEHLQKKTTRLNLNSAPRT